MRLIIPTVKVRDAVAIYQKFIYQSNKDLVQLLTKLKLEKKDWENNNF